MLTRPFPVIRAISLILFAVIFEGNCSFAGNPKPGSLEKNPNKPATKTLYYIGFAGRKMIKPLKNTEYVVEVYKLPGTVVMQLNKLRFSSKQYNNTAVKKQQLLLASLKDSCRVYIVRNRLKYKYFYPCGLKNGMTIQENEFLQWDFVGQLDFNNPVGTQGKSDSANSENVKPGTDHQTGQLIVPAMRPYVFYPWDINAKIDSDTSYSPSMASLIDSLFNHIEGYSDCLGAQRIKLELFDQPFVADFYANMYIHYVDSIVNILKKNPLIKPGKFENFIVNVSLIITNRFKYGSNLQLWNGIRRDRLDCDNTAFLVHDIGKKLGFEVSVVALWEHAMVVVGNYAYETTKRTYFPKKQLKDHYSTIYWITADHKKIHALLTLLELSFYLESKGEKNKAENFRKIWQQYHCNVISF